MLLGAIDGIHESTAGGLEEGNSRRNDKAVSGRRKIEGRN